jgi:D-lactate dehydrogenase
MQKAVEHFTQALERQHPDIMQWRDAPHRFAYGTDASFYRLTPAVVVQANDEAQVRAILSLAAEHDVSVTFRAAGTSLSGQAVTDSVLMLLGAGWQDIRIEQDGHVVHLNPGVIGAHANRALAPFGRKIGPDPASINSCKIGGIVANNASGMCCGTAQNTYHTMAGLRMILADGTLIDTRDPASVSSFKHHQAELLAALSKIMADTHADPVLVDKIRHKYRIKNTTGYSLNALIDFEDPIDVLSHLMVGSEGTLGFIADIAYHTVSDAPFKSAILVGFTTIGSCCAAVQALKALPVSAVELIDSRGIKATAHHPSVPAFIGQLPDGAAALLIDVRGETADELAINAALISSGLAAHDVVADSGFSTDPDHYEQLWGFRKGLFPALGAVRDTGTTVVIEDVAFPMADLAAGVERLQACFDTHGYDDAFIFGHALEGNLHFVFSQSFATQQDRDRYEAFMTDVTYLVAVEFGGSLKAEHGTGRNMAPFVSLEWGEDAYQLMKRIKQLLDPSNLLNPGVILNDDPNVHIKNLKDLPAANPLIDKCIECGFCETVCPSKNLTYTPRQRIALWREISRLTNTGEQPALLKELQDSYWSEGLDSCAATGMCAARCPVGINTGDLVKQQRQIANSKHQRKAQWAVAHLPTLIKTAAIGIQVAQTAHDIMGTNLLTKTTQVLNRVTRKAVPLWTDAMPRRAKNTRKPATQAPIDGAQAFVYWPSCVSQVMGPAKADPHQQSQMDVVLQLAERAGIQLHVPSGIGDVCCGQPFASKGFPEQAAQSQDALVAVLQPYIDQGMTIVSDTSPCALRLSESAVPLMDSMTFAAEVLIPKLPIKSLPKTVVLHVPCSAKRSGLSEISLQVAQRCADYVVVPHNIECCGFAGDKGFTQPELNASALQTLKAQAVGCDSGYSTSRTCEIGLSRHGGLSFQSLLYLIEEASR